MFKQIDSKIIETLNSIVGEANLVTEHEKMLDYTGDEFALEEIRTFPEVVVRPGSTEEISRVLQLCTQESIPVTPRGGGTGLCGGCVPLRGGILMTFERMNRVLEVDTDNLIVTVEPGVTLMDFYAAVEQHGLYFPPHPGDESATIGGVINTNAGGARALKYGIVRSFIRGIQVVLPDGRVMTVGGKLMKNSSGYSLMHLLIGSEGTLGVVTKAYINLLAPPKLMHTLIVPYNDLHDAIRSVPRMIQNKILPMSVEFVEMDPIRVCEDALDKKWPCQEGDAHLMIIIDAAGEEEIMALAERIGAVCLEENAIDVFVADSRERQQTILEIRSHIYEALKPYSLELLDVTVPRAEIARFVSDVHELEAELETWIPTYGHAADGNVHNHIMQSRWQDGSWSEIADFKGKYRMIRDGIHRLGKKYGGIVSGEHGIGLVKKEYLLDFIGQDQVALMRSIKGVFDPKGILNPGKIFD
jgi:glycolate oxidase